MEKRRIFSAFIFKFSIYVLHGLPTVDRLKQQTEGKKYISANNTF